MIEIRNVKPEDIEMLDIVENRCFPIEEAASHDAFVERIEILSDSFFVAEKEGKIVGLVNGPVVDKEFITDDLFDKTVANPPSGGHQTILGLAVDPSCQKQGLAGKLLDAIEKESRAKQRLSITLTCKEELIKFYESHGYKNMGVSESQHGGVVWYNMTKKL